VSAPCFYLLGWGVLGWSLTILSAVATAKLVTLGETGLREQVRRWLEPWRRARAERRRLRLAMRQVRQHKAALETCERRYRGRALG
jgi:hypothetical protein